jgi:hypothetical protein
METDNKNETERCFLIRRNSFRSAVASRTLLYLSRHTKSPLLPANELNCLSVYMSDSSSVPVEARDSHEDFFAAAGVNVPKTQTDRSFLKMTGGGESSLSLTPDDPATLSFEINRESENQRSAANIGSESSFSRKSMREAGSNFLRTVSRMSGADKVVNHVSEIIGPLTHGYFDDWDRYQLVTVLIEDCVEIRLETTIELSALIDMADEHFVDRGCPSKPRPLSKRAIEERNSAALKIQTAWINRKFNKSITANILDLLMRAKLEEELTEEEQSMAKAILLTESESMSMKGVEGDTHSTDNEKARQVDAELLKPYAPPSVKFAQLYADHNHPRKGAKSKKDHYSCMKTTTGRHCTLGGCGEQLDLWNEGQVSEFGKFGPGITNYFKFVKWAFWTFVALAVIQAAPIAFNSYGNDEVDSNSSVDFIFRTTAGNLGNGNHTFEITLPGCDTGAYHGSTCHINKSNVAIAYSSLNIAAAVFVLVSFVWLRIFELREAAVLDKNTVSASDYTVVVSNLPKKCNEMEMRAHFAQVTGYAVADVFFAYDNAEQIEHYKTRGRLMKERYRLVQLYRFHNSVKGSSRKSDSFFKKIDEERRQVSLQIKKIDAKMSAEEAEGRVDYSVVLLAYVTFDEAVGAKKALQVYKKNWWSWLCMDNATKFKSHRIIVDRAPEPSTIVWENLGFSPKQQQFRRNITWIFAFLLIFLSAIASFTDRSLEQRYQNDNKVDCPPGFGEMAKEEQKSYAESHPGTEHCYCNQLSPQDMSSDSFCASYYKTQVRSDVLTYFAAFIVVAMNCIIDWILKKCAAFEKHHSLDGMEKSIFGRLFFLKFINSGLIILLSNVQLGTSYNSNSDGSNDFTVEWYGTIGVNIILVQLGNIIVPHVWKFYYWYKMQKAIAAQKEDPMVCMTQEELNSLYLGPEFVISSRYAQILSDMFICLMFSTGMPILIVIAVVNFYVTYWVDKFLFVNFYRTPPYYKTEIGRMASAIIPYAVLVYLAFAVWTMGSREIFSTKDASDSSSYFT